MRAPRPALSALLLVQLALLIAISGACSSVSAAPVPVDLDPLIGPLIHLGQTGHPGFGTTFNLAANVQNGYHKVTNGLTYRYQQASDFIRPTYQRGANYLRTGYNGLSNGFVTKVNRFADGVGDRWQRLKDRLGRPINSSWLPFGEATSKFRGFSRLLPFRGTPATVHPSPEPPQSIAEKEASEGNSIAQAIDHQEVGTGPHAGNSIVETIDHQEAGKDTPAGNGVVQAIRQEGSTLSWKKPEGLQAFQTAFDTPKTSERLLSLIQDREKALGQLRGLTQDGPRGAEDISRFEIGPYASIPSTFRLAKQGKSKSANIELIDIDYKLSDLERQAMLALNAWSKASAARERNVEAGAESERKALEAVKAKLDAITAAKAELTDLGLSYSQTRIYDRYSGARTVAEALLEAHKYLEEARGARTIASLAEENQATELEQAFQKHKPQLNVAMADLALAFDRLKPLSEERAFLQSLSGVDKVFKDTQQQLIANMLISRERGVKDLASLYDTLVDTYLAQSRPAHLRTPKELLTTIPEDAEVPETL